jgi:hypothetical protein
MNFQVFSGVFASVSDECFKCFICLYTYVTNVLFRYFKSRSDISHVVMAPVTDHSLPFVRELSDQRHGLSWITGSSGARSPKTMQSRGMEGCGCRCEKRRSHERPNRWRGGGTDSR